MADTEVLDITERAVLRTPEVELKPEQRICEMCDKPARMLDNRCSKHSRYRYSAREMKHRAREYMDRHSLRYVALLEQSMEVAAAKGKTTQILDVLKSTSVADTPKTSETRTQVGVKVILGGTPLPGLKEGA